MVSRAPVSAIHNNTQMGTARATVREVDDDHLMQEIKHADVFHSETPSDFERWQMVGMTAVPIKQQEEEQQQQSQQSQQSELGIGGDFNQQQPKGPAAEALMVYVGGSRSHPVGIVDDRRVRPYGMKEGEGAHYAPDGSEQMTFFNEKGAYLVSLDGTSVKDKKEKKTRMASLRHVDKDMQTHKIEKKQQGGQGQQSQQQKEQYKHEGKKVNTEVRVIKDRIEFRAGEKVVGYYEVSSDTWFFTGKVIHNQATETMKDESKKIQRTASESISDNAPRIDHN